MDECVEDERSRSVKVQNCVEAKRELKRKDEAKRRNERGGGRKRKREKFTKGPFILQGRKFRHRHL